MRIAKDLFKKEILDENANLMGKVVDVIFDEDTFEITDVVVKKVGIAESLKSNGEDIVPVEFIGTIGDKILIKKDDGI